MTPGLNNRTRFARRANSRVAYDPGEPPAGDATLPTVVLLHDLLRDRSSWNEVRSLLAPEFRVIVPDSRGHGASSTLTNQWYTIGELSSDVASILDTEGVRTAHLVGHGLGAATALELARRAPTQVVTLTLIDLPSAIFNPEPLNKVARGERETLKATHREAADAAYKGLTDRALDTYMHTHAGQAWRELHTKQTLSSMRRHAPGLAALLPALDSYAIDATALREITIPMLILASQPVSVLDQQVQARLAEIAGNSSSITFRLFDPSEHEGTSARNTLIREHLRAAEP